MPIDEDVQESAKVAGEDPYTDPEAAFAIWHDPTTYDLMKHGPPYLPGDGPMAGGRIASVRPDFKSTVRPLVEKTSADSLTSILVIAQHIVADFAETPMSVLAALLAFLRAESMLHQAHHWQARGNSQYGDHLLFDRIYTSVVESIDKLAERMVGSSHTVLASPVLHARHTSAVMQMFHDGLQAQDPSPDENVLLSLRAALQTLVLLKFVYSALEQKGLLSHGTDNLLQGIADTHEEHVYLLRQRASQRTASYDHRSVAMSDSRWKFK
jgi:DNA-binding ferritin-like protein